MTNASAVAVRRWPGRRVLRHLPLLVLTLALPVLVLIPAVNAPVLWFGMPPLLLCSVAGVLLLTPALALVEFGRGGRSGQDGGERA